MFGKKKEEGLKPMGGAYIGGISGVEPNIYFEAELNKDNSALNIKIGKKDIVLPIEKIQAIEVGSEIEILEKSKSVIGRGAVGALFGPVGAIIGAASGTGTKKKEKKKNLAVISYLSNGEINNITINLGDDLSPHINRAKKYKEHLDHLLYGDGPIQL